MNSKKYSPDSKAGVVEVASLDDIYSELKKKRQGKVDVSKHRVTQRTKTREKENNNSDEYTPNCPKVIHKNWIKLFSFISYCFVLVYSKSPFSSLLTTCPGGIRTRQDTQATITPDGPPVLLCWSNPRP